jgi:glutamine amidotransferase/cyclase
MRVSLLDYGAGNVRSVRNAILANGYEVIDIETPEQVLSAECIIFPGVGSFRSAMDTLIAKGLDAPLRQYLQSQERPFLGICLGMQTLFESSEEGGNVPGLGIIPGQVLKFDSTKMIVPHIGWNGRILHQEQSPLFRYIDPEQDETYFVHSYYAAITEQNAPWVLTSTTYSGTRFVSAVQKGCVVATQFHPEKSGRTGLHILKGFLEVRWNAFLIPPICFVDVCFLFLPFICVRLPRTGPWPLPNRYMSIRIGRRS